MVARTGGRGLTVDIVHGRSDDCYRPRPDGVSARVAATGRGWREPSDGPYRPATMRHRSLAPSLVLSLALLLVGCEGVGSIASLLPAAGPVLTVTTRGGECVDGPCGSATIVERDGRVRTTAPAAADLGTLDPAALTALDSAIKTADYDAIRARPFTGECPVNFDGQEFVYEFGAPGGTERIATCETEIDPNHPLFDAISAALAELSNR
jgi:hypothetical protein